jgi:hypothetical protein
LKIKKEALRRERLRFRLRQSGRKPFSFSFFSPRLKAWADTNPISGGGRQVIGDLRFLILIENLCVLGVLCGCGLKPRSSAAKGVLRLVLHGRWPTAEGRRLMTVFRESSPTVSESNPAGK